MVGICSLFGPGIELAMCCLGAA